MTAFTSPKTWSAAALTAAEMNTQVRDNLKNIDERLTVIGQTSATVVGQNKAAAYGCVLQRTADQTITTATDTAITFPAGSVTEELDTDGFHSTASNTARVTIPAGGDGWYDVGGTVLFATDATGIRALWVEKNGTAGAGTSVAATRVSGESTAAVAITASGIVLLAAGDYVALGVLQTSGGNLAATAASYAPRLWVLRRFTA